MSAVSVTKSVDVAVSRHPAAGHSGKAEPLPRMLVSVTEAARSLGVSRSFAYELVAAGVLRSIRLGRRVLIPVAALEDLLPEDNVEI
ncbi:MAG: helix-turn-helix domain-containing protein [Acidobacteriota bacterium]|nr:helix-turn-helix domain-containing protein [Acidobacteriota bacterium]